MKKFEYKESSYPKVFLSTFLRIVFLVLLAPALSMLFISFISGVFFDYSTKASLKALEETIFWFAAIKNTDIFVSIAVASSAIMIPTFLVSFYLRNYRKKRAQIYVIDNENNKLYLFQHALASRPTGHIISRGSVISELPFGDSLIAVHNLNAIKDSVITLNEIMEDNPDNIPVTAIWYFDRFVVKKKSSKGLWLTANVMNMIKEDDKMKSKKFFISSKYNDYEELCSYIENRAVNNV